MADSAAAESLCLGSVASETGGGSGRYPCRANGVDPPPATHGRSTALRIQLICRCCLEDVELRDGILVRHWRDSEPPTLCPASYGPASRARRPTPADIKRQELRIATRAQRRKRLRAVYEAARLAMDPRDLDPVPAPTVLPKYEGRWYVAVMLPGTGPADVWLPDMTRGDQRRYIGRYLPSAHGLRWNTARGCWSVPTRHFRELASHLLRFHPTIMLGREFNPYERCNGSCRHAIGLECQCSCLAKFHGKGRWKAGWVEVSEFDTLHRGTSWHWTLFSVSGEARPRSLHRWAGG